MDLSEQQQRVIKDWAARTPLVEEVRLFGNRAKGGAPSDSDVDLAVTVASGAAQRTIESHYAELGQYWQNELTKLLEPLRAHVNLYNAEDEKVRRICEEFSVLLYP
jgi:predicted nucleotidyltransferase